mgnify:FL=1
MDEKKINKKTQMKVFTKVMNLQHFMPTRFAYTRLLILRYTVEYDFSALPKEGVEAAEKKAALKTIAKTFQER